jgi:UDP-2,4-diacetamido-2,4,6-trideoxy-beta-L-altropyranose hydrolase
MNLAGYKWLIRVASRPEAGGGHVSRCRALLRSLLEYGPVTVMLDRTGGAWTPYFAMPNVDVVSSDDQLASNEYSWVILDDFEANEHDVTTLNKYAPVAIFDDTITPPKNVDIVINPAPQLNGNNVDGIPALLGPRYAPLDTGYQNIRLRKQSASPQHIVISFGHRDAWNATGLTLRALELLMPTEAGPLITVALGSSAVHLEEVRRHVAELGDRATLSIDAKDMPGLMTSADLMIGAGGLNLLERMACGTPSVTIRTNDRQRFYIDGAARIGATLYAGTVSELTSNGLAETLRRLMDDEKTRRSMAKKGRNLVDGNGCGRIAAALFQRSKSPAQVSTRVEMGELHKGKVDTDLY